ncbi:hypothetical protein [Ferrovibrio sp.]|uniref:hypothetical protein n=1 Tax=Ferrovibrio sp. TaxID=1917215 RepID=UPI001B45914F|nr:hypothetical protein [Ferrovibrio sp.]MBP7065797.1 hypothetical protein [Ferrovibrio sp.]
MIKKVALALAVIILLVAGGVYYLFSNLDSLIKVAIETYGTEATQARVSVGKVSIGLKDGSGAISDMKVANPKGFNTPEALSLGEISLKLDVATLQQNPIVIKEVVINRPQITYEFAQGGSNLETIQKNTQAYAQKMGPGGSKPDGAATPAKDGKAETKVIIENLYVRSGQIGMSHAALQGRAVNTPLPTIHLTDIGKSKGGATPAEVAERVLGSISQQAARVGGAELQKQLGDQLKGAVGGVTGGAGSASDKLKGLIGK